MRDPSCVKTRTGPISTNYLYNFNPIYRGISGQFSLARHKIAPPSDASAFLHNQDPKVTLAVSYVDLLMETLRFCLFLTFVEAPLRSLDLRLT